MDTEKDSAPIDTPTEEPKTEEPTVEEPSTEEPKNAESPSEETKSEDATNEEEPTNEETSKEVDEAPASEEVTPEEPPTEEPPADDGTDEKPEEQADEPSHESQEEDGQEETEKDADADESEAPEESKEEVEQDAPPPPPEEEEVAEEVAKEVAEEVSEVAEEVSEVAEEVTEEVADEGSEEAPPPPEEEDVPSEEPPAPVATPTSNGTGESAEDDDLYSHMSIKVDITDEDALRRAIADVRSDAAGINRKSWVVAGHVDNTPNMVEVKAQDTSEEANLEDFRQLLEDDQVMYALVRTVTTVDMSAAVKFVYVHWIGEQVPFARRGRYGVVHGSVEDYFNPYHVVIETGNRDELTEEELIKTLEEKNMTVNKIVATPTDNKHERGFTQHQQKRKAPSQTPKAVAPAGNQVEVTPELNKAIGEVRDDSSDVTWLIAGYEDNDIKKPLVVVNKGSGGADELKEHLNNEHVQYALVRTSDTYDEIVTVKFVYVYWIGEDVKPMMKGKVYANAGPIEQIFSPIHVTLSVTNVDEISEEIVNDKVSSGSGSKSFVK